MPTTTMPAIMRDLRVLNLLSIMTIFLFWMEIVNAACALELAWGVETEEIVVFL
uniref:Uncharacterized protein n=1 Tax=mine drainage metagenome TaxID=410659 RepID=E6Q8U9_9ZZZZ